MSYELSTIPIFLFCSEGRPWYLETVLRQIRKFNPQCPVILFGNQLTADIGQGVRHLQWQEYEASVAYFRTIYRHNSINSLGFEMACFERWFLMRDYMNAHDIECAWQLDTDVMVFENLVAEAQRLSRYDISLSRLISGHCSYWKRERVSDFCERILSYYREEALSKAIKKANISDMTLLQKFAQEQFHVFDSACSIDGSFYDHALDLSVNGLTDEPCEMFGGYKKIYWRQGLPFVRMRKSNDYVRLKTVHCQGAAKHCIMLLAKSSAFSVADLFISRVLAQARKAFQLLINLRHTHERVH